MIDTLISQLPLFGYLLLSVVLGFLIGLERKARYKEAGIRTHTIVCFGSALVVIVSKFAFSGDFDSARVAAQVVSGIGFLGAGMIIYRPQGVHGLTTAAGVWTTAGVGMACGGGLYLVAIVATIIIIVVQCVLHLNVKLFMRKKVYSIKISFIQNEDENTRIKQIFGTDRFNQLVIHRGDGKLLYNAVLHTEVEYSSTYLNDIIKQNDCIISIERCDID